MIIHKWNSKSKIDTWARGPEIVGTWVRWPPDPFLTFVNTVFAWSWYFRYFVKIKPWWWMVVVIDVHWFLCFDRLMKDVGRLHWHRPVTDQNHPKFSRLTRCLVRIASRLMFTTSSLDQLLKVSSSPTMVTILNFEAFNIRKSSTFIIYLYSIHFWVFVFRLVGLLMFCEVN